LRQKQLIERPTLADLTVSAQRRLGAFLPEGLLPAWEGMRPRRLVAARRPGAWQGRRLDLRRYSARQGEELELRGAGGVLDLPEGPGELWPLLGAATWLPRRNAARSVRRTDRLTGWPHDRHTCG
jgi:hypothetical protein